MVADCAKYLARTQDCASVMRGERRIAGPVARPREVIYTTTGDGRWVIQHPQIADNGALVALALDGSQRRVVLAPYAYSMPMMVAGGSELIAARVAVGGASGGGVGSTQSFCSVRNDPASASPFGRPQKLFTALVGDLPGRNYAVGMRENRFVFKQHVVGRRCGRFAWSARGTRGWRVGRGGEGGGRGARGRERSGR